MTIDRQDLEWAVQRKLLTGQQAEDLWQAVADKNKHRHRFDLTHLMYYAGALLVMGAMGWLITETWERLGGSGIFLVASAYALFFLAVGLWLWFRKGFRIAGGLFVTLSVWMVPLMTYGLQRWLGVWGGDDPGSYHDFHRWIRGGWFAMEVATLIAGAAALRFVRFPFLTVPIAITLWYMSMDATPIIVQMFATAPDTADFWNWRLNVSMVFGLAMIVFFYAVDRLTRRDYAFWGYLFGTVAFWGALSNMESHGELSKAVYCLINVVLLGSAVYLRRRVFLVFGAIGVFLYLSHLAHMVFHDTIAFSIVLTVIGIALLWFGTWLHRNGKRMEEKAMAALPPMLRRARPAERLPWD
jgi:hypothetical protein